MKNIDAIYQQKTVVSSEIDSLKKKIVPKNLAIVNIL